MSDKTLKHHQLPIVASSHARTPKSCLPPLALLAAWRFNKEELNAQYFDSPPWRSWRSWRFNKEELNAQHFDSPPWRSWRSWRFNKEELNAQHFDSPLCALGALGGSIKKN
jgi:hypothetical protein